jgi:predicted regulator of Ras-like GTPase activity (Roadblock/LC7/MglB family)
VQTPERGFSIAEWGAIREDHEVASLSINEPRYRYQEVAPEYLTVPVSELLEKLPEEFRGEGGSQDLSIDLPCSHLLAGNTPGLSLVQLNELLPDLVVIPEGADGSHRFSLPAGWIALHYRLVTKREEIPQERVERVERVEEVEMRGADEGGTAPKTSSALGSRSTERMVSESKKPAIIDAEVVNTAPSLKTEGTQGEDSAPTRNKAESTKNEASKEEHAPPPSPKRGLFASLPMFRRHQPESAAPNRAPSAPTEKTRENSTERPVRAEQSVEQGQSDASSAITLESLWKLDPEDQLADPSSLQALFMTEEKLTLDRVIEMAGQLPGLRACVLAHGEHVVCASQTPTGIDLQTLSGQAMTMLAQIRESSSNMGLGAVPAITLHAEQGALSFLHNGELCLLVLHTDRGFVPGVRERLQEMLGHLSDARPLLTGKNGVEGRGTRDEG